MSVCFSCLSGPEEPHVPSLPVCLWSCKKELSAAAVATWPGSKGSLSHFICRGCNQSGGNPPGEQFQRSDACAGLSFLPH